MPETKFLDLSTLTSSTDISSMVFDNSGNFICYWILFFIAKTGWCTANIVIAIKNQ